MAKMRGSIMVGDNTAYMDTYAGTGAKNLQTSPNPAIKGKKPPKKRPGSILADFVKGGPSA